MDHKDMSSTRQAHTNTLDTPAHSGWTADTHCIYWACTEYNKDALHTVGISRHPIHKVGIYLTVCAQYIHTLSSG